MVWRDDATCPLDFPKENPERAFEALKVLQPDGSVYRAPVEDWDGARRRVVEDPKWMVWLGEQQTTVDAWMSRHQESRRMAGGVVS